jgi:hypothetical protein
VNVLLKRWKTIAIVSVVAVALLAVFMHDSYEPPKEPTEPAAIEAKHFAHSLRIPDSVPTASFYPWWLGDKAYFDYLCEKEAGEFIFRKIEKVDGIYQMRPRDRSTERELQDRYSMEDPYGYTEDVASSLPVLFIKSPKKGYAFLETKSSPAKAHLDPRSLAERTSGKTTSLLGQATSISEERPFWRYFYEPTPNLHDAKIVAETTQALKSRYGYTWRGIRRPHDREKGIAGGELVVLDLATNEVLGIRRGFVYSKATNIPSGIFWLFGKACPHSNSKTPARPYQFDYEFVSKVLSPSFSMVGETGANHGR